MQSLQLFEVRICSCNLFEVISTLFYCRFATLHRMAPLTGDSIKQILMFEKLLEMTRSDVFYCKNSIDTTDTKILRKQLLKQYKVGLVNTSCCRYIFPGKFRKVSNEIVDD